MYLWLMSTNERTRLKRTVTNSQSDIHQPYVPFKNRWVEVRTWKWNTGEHLIEITRSNLPAGYLHDDMRLGRHETTSIDNNCQPSRQ